MSPAFSRWPRALRRTISGAPGTVASRRACFLPIKTAGECYVAQMFKMYNVYNVCWRQKCDAQTHLVYATAPEGVKMSLARTMRLRECDSVHQSPIAGSRSRISYSSHTNNFLAHQMRYSIHLKICAVRWRGIMAIW